MLFTILSSLLMSWSHVSICFSDVLLCLPSLSVRLWWWMGVAEPAGQCCCPCSGLCRVVCSPGATCSSKVEPPAASLWTWPETFSWNVSLHDTNDLVTALWPGLHSLFIRRRSLLLIIEVWWSKRSSLSWHEDVRFDDEWMVYFNRCGSVPGKRQSYSWFPTGEIHWWWNYWQTRQLHPLNSLQTTGNTLMILTCLPSWILKLTVLNDWCNICCGPGRWFCSWSCALWTSLTACCWRASPLWSSYSKACRAIPETSFLRSVNYDLIEFMQPLFPLYEYEWEAEYANQYSGCAEL